MTDQPTGKLAQELEGVSELALAWARQVLGMPIDPESSALLRAQSSAAGTILNTQLRADALRLRAQRSDKALETLLKLIREKELVVPPASVQARNEGGLLPLQSLVPHA